MPARTVSGVCAAAPCLSGVFGADGTSLFRLRRGATSMKKAKEDKAVFEETPAAPEDEAVPTQEGVGAGGVSPCSWRALPAVGACRRSTTAHCRPACPHRL